MMVATDLHLEYVSIPVKMDLGPLHNGRVQRNHTARWRAGPSGKGAVPRTYCCSHIWKIRHLVAAIAQSVWVMPGPHC